MGILIDFSTQLTFVAESCIRHPDFSVHILNNRILGEPGSNKNSHKYHFSISVSVTTDDFFLQISSIGKLRTPELRTDFNH